MPIEQVKNMRVPEGWAGMSTCTVPVSGSSSGGVTTLDAPPLRYNERDTLLNPHFIAYGDGSRRWAELF